MNCYFSSVTRVSNTFLHPTSSMTWFQASKDKCLLWSFALELGLQGNVKWKKYVKQIWHLKVIREIKRWESKLIQWCQKISNMATRSTKICSLKNSSTKKLSSIFTATTTFLYWHGKNRQKSKWTKSCFFLNELTCPKVYPSLPFSNLTIFLLFRFNLTSSFCPCSYPLWSALQSCYTLI